MGCASFAPPGPNQSTRLKAWCGDAPAGFPKSSPQTSRPVKHPPPRGPYSPLTGAGRRPIIHLEVPQQEFAGTPASPTYTPLSKKLQSSVVVRARASLWSPGGGQPLFGAGGGSRPPPSRTDIKHRCHQIFFCQPRNTHPFSSLTYLSLGGTDWGRGGKDICEPTPGLLLTSEGPGGLQGRSWAGGPSPSPRPPRRSPPWRTSPPSSCASPSPSRSATWEGREGRMGGRGSSQCPHGRPGSMGHGSVPRCPLRPSPRRPLPPFPCCASPADMGRGGFPLRSPRVRPSLPIWASDRPVG